MTSTRLNAFTAPASIRWARHEHVQICRNTEPVSKSICIAPAAGSAAERGALRALAESRKDVFDKFERR